MSNLKDFVQTALEEAAGEEVVVLGEYDRDAIEEAHPDQTFVFATESQQQDAALLAKQPKLCIIDPRGEAIGRFTEELIDEVKGEPNLAFVFTHTGELDAQQQHDLDRVKQLLLTAELPFYDSIGEAVDQLTAPEE